MDSQRLDSVACGLPLPDAEPAAPARQASGEPVSLGSTVNGSSSAWTPRRPLNSILDPQAVANGPKGLALRKHCSIGNAVIPEHDIVQRQAQRLNILTAGEPLQRRERPFAGGVHERAKISSF